MMLIITRGNFKVYSDVCAEIKTNNEKKGERKRERKGTTMMMMGEKNFSCLCVCIWIFYEHLSFIPVPEWNWDWAELIAKMWELFRLIVVIIVVVFNMQTLTGDQKINQATVSRHHHHHAFHVHKKMWYEFVCLFSSLAHAAKSEESSCRSPLSLSLLAPIMINWELTSDSFSHLHDEN
jgi:hypothetical protein